MGMDDSVDLELALLYTLFDLRDGRAQGTVDSQLCIE